MKNKYPNRKLLPCARRTRDTTECSLMSLGELIRTASFSTCHWENWSGQPHSVHVFCLIKRAGPQGFYSDGLSQLTAHFIWHSHSLGYKSIDLCSLKAHFTPNFSYHPDLTAKNLHSVLFDGLPGAFQLQIHNSHFLISYAFTNDYQFNLKSALFFSNLKIPTRTNQWKSIQT